MRTRNSWSCWRFWVITRKKDLLSSLWTNRSTQTDCSKTWWKPRTPACLYMEVLSHTLTAIWWITKLLWHHPLVSQVSFRSLISLFVFFFIILNFHWLADCQSLFNFRYLGWSGLFKQRPGILKSLIKPHEFIFFCPPNVNIQSVSFISVSYIFRFLFCHGHIYYKLVILCLSKESISTTETASSTILRMERVVWWSPPLWQPEALMWSSWSWWSTTTVPTTTRTTFTGPGARAEQATRSAPLKGAHLILDIKS